VLKISEVYEKQIRVINERPDGSEMAVFEKTLDTRECLINKKYIVSIHPYEFTSSMAAKKVDAAFPEGTKFSTLVMDGNSFRRSELIVVGSFEKFCRLLREDD